MAEHREEIAKLRSTIGGMTKYSINAYCFIFEYFIGSFSFESEMKEIKFKMQSMADVYENLQEKMHDVDKTM